jgi:hypothetical protein
MILLSPKSTHRGYDSASIKGISDLGAAHLGHQENAAHVIDHHRPAGRYSRD